MKNITKVVLMMVLLLIFNFGCNSSNSTKQEDLDFLTSSLEKNHKNLYANISKEDFTKKKNEIKNNLSKMNDFKYFMSLRELIALVGDAHTRISIDLTNYSEDYRIYPFAIEEYEDNWYLLISNKENEKYLGSIVTEINGISISKVFERGKKITSFENEVQAISQFNQEINHELILEYLGIAKSGEPIVLTLLDEDEKISFDSLLLKDINDDNLRQFKPSSIPQTAPSGFYRSLPINDDIFFVQYNMCQEATDLKMSEFVSKNKEFLENNNFKKLIIDMRYNGGGDSRIFQPFIKMVKDLNKDIKVYTLIGKNTFSSAILNAVETKNELNSTLVGTPTGGNANHYGEVKFLKMNDFPGAITYSTKYFETIPNYDKDSLYPDVEVKQTFKDLVDGKDSVVEWIIKEK